MLTYLKILFVVVVLVIIVIILIPSKKKPETKGKFKFVLKTHGTDLEFNDPFDNFLVYAGANSGKTASIAKPLLEQYIINGFAGLVYDFKEKDLTKTVNHLVKKHNYNNATYLINFTDLSRSHRANIIKPSLFVDNQNLFLQLITDLLDAYKGDTKDDGGWLNGALGIFKGAAINFYKLYPEYCTVPHISNYICATTTDKLKTFLLKTHDSKVLASAFLKAESENTSSSYLSTLVNFISPLAINRNISYVLTGDDFDFNLLDPENPKLVTVSNSYSIEKQLSPIISMMITSSSRRFTIENKIPFFYCLDEATTFKIPEFEGLPSVLREYKCSFMLLTQSGSKIERRYSKLEKSSIESNFSNLFIGKTQDVEALKNYPLIFGKYEKERVSKSKGSSRGGDSRSTTKSYQKEDVYDTGFFTSLETGEFVGRAAHSKTKTFHVRFKKYDDEEEELPIIRTVLQSDIENNYEKIISDLESII